MAIQMWLEGSDNGKIYFLSYHLFVDCHYVYSNNGGSEFVGLPASVSCLVYWTNRVVYYDSMLCAIGVEGNQ